MHVEHARLVFAVFPKRPFLHRTVRIAQRQSESDHVPDLPVRQILCIEKLKMDNVRFTPGT